MRLILAIFLLTGGSFYGLSLHKETDEKVLQEIKNKDDLKEFKNWFLKNNTIKTPYDYSLILGVRKINKFCASSYL